MSWKNHDHAPESLLYRLQTGYQFSGNPEHKIPKVSNRQLWWWGVCQQTVVNQQADSNPLIFKVTNATPTGIVTVMTCIIRTKSIFASFWNYAQTPLSFTRSFGSIHAHQFRGTTRKISAISIMNQKVYACKVHHLLNFSKSDRRKSLEWKFRTVLTVWK